MKVQRKVSQTTILEVEGQTVAEVFENLARLEEIFSGHETCGLCKGTGVQYQVRQDKDGNKYYQAVCRACGAEFRFGVKKSPPGALFPQLKDKDGNRKPDGGWAKWQGHGQDSEGEEPRARPYQHEREPGY
jgi:hypothetical protein